MGNSPSSPKAPPLPPKDPFDANRMVSSPHRLSGSTHHRSSSHFTAPDRRMRTASSVNLTMQANGSIQRHRSAAVTSTSAGSALAVPSAGQHRRSRSTSAVRADHEAESWPPPPPYSAVGRTVQSSGTGNGDVKVNPSDEMEPPKASRQTIAESNSSSSLQVPQDADGRAAHVHRAKSFGSRHTHVYTVSNIVTSPVSTSSDSRTSPQLLEYLKSSTEDALEMLRKYDTVIIVDDSTSMSLQNRWEEAREALAALAEIAAQYDADGIDVHFLNNEKVGLNMRSSPAVKRLFDSVKLKRSTPIGGKLEELLLDYMSQLEGAKSRRDAGDRTALKDIKPVNYIVLTDGAPTDDPKSVIIAAAKRLDAGNFPLTQVGIQFIQVGRSERAAAFLKELDDGLVSHHNVRDIVDTTPYTGGIVTAEMFIKCLVGGINRRVDNKGGASVM